MYLVWAICGGVVALNVATASASPGSFPRPGAQCGLPAVELLPALPVELAGHDQGGLPRPRQHRLEYDRGRAQPHLEFRLPSVVSLKTYSQAGAHSAFTRFNVFLRDRFTCQYCGDT